MKNGQISVYYGGKGKTCMVLGRGLHALGDHLRVVMIQFMDYQNKKEVALLEKLEPDFRFFCFDKERSEEQLDDCSKKGIESEIKNAFSFSKKIVDTGECDMLVLDGILECIEKGYLSEESLAELLEKRPAYLDIILTGSTLPAQVGEKADFVYKIQTEKEMNE